MLLKYSFGKDDMYMKCRLENASSVVVISTDNQNWEATQYNAGDIGHRKSNLIKLGCTLMSNMLGGVDEDQLDIKVLDNPVGITLYGNFRDSNTSEFVGNGLVAYDDEGQATIECNANLPEEVYDDIENKINSGAFFGESVCGDVKYFFDLR